jgi:transcriptional regulator with XRE-family HTH domain
MPRYCHGNIPTAQSAIIGTNVRALRLRNGWTLAELGKLMGWPTEATVCAAEGRRSSWQRRFSTREVEQLAAIFGVSTEQLNTRCVNCAGHPPVGFACLICGATSPKTE